jgi:hypothetical protein
VVNPARVYFARVPQVGWSAVNILGQHRSVNEMTVTDIIYMRLYIGDSCVAVQAAV